MKMKLIPVIALKNKQKDNRFLASSMDVGDWSDEDLDVALSDIENAFLIWNKDLRKITIKEALEVTIKESRAHKKLMIETFGKDVFINYDVEKWLEYYEPVYLEITKEQFEHARELAFI